jgi:hypothetical protein
MEEPSTASEADIGISGARSELIFYTIKEPVRLLDKSQSLSNAKPPLLHFEPFSSKFLIGFAKAR